MLKTRINIILLKLFGGRREKMKKYVYRRHLREAKRTIIYIISYLLSLFLVYGAVSLITLKRKERLSFIEGDWKNIGIILLIIILGCLFVYVTYLRKLQEEKYILYEDKIVYIDKTQEKIIYLKDIKEIYCSKNKLIKGSLRIKSKDTIIKIKMSIENVSDFIQNLKGSLDENNLSGVYDSDKIYNLYISASYVDDTWERLYELLKFVPPILGVCIVVSFITSFLVQEYNIKLIILCILYLFPMILLTTSELILLIKHKVEIKKEQYVVRMRDYQYEHRVFDAVVVILIIIILTILVFFIIKY